MIQARTYYCGRYGGVRKLIDLTGLWVDVSLGANGITDAANAELFDVAVDPNNGDHVIVVGDAHCEQNWFGIAVSTNGGGNWQVPTGNYQALTTNTICYYKWNKVSVVNSSVIYACGNVDANTGKGIVIKSTDGGLSFNVCAQLPAIVNVLDVTSIHFTSPLVGVIGLNNYICKTIDGGNTWVVMNGGLVLSTNNPSPAPLPIGAITGIHITNDESSIVAVGANFVINSTPTFPINGSGMTSGEWEKSIYPPADNFPSYSATGTHLSYLNPSFGLDNFIFITGLSELGIFVSAYPGVWINQSPSFAGGLDKSAAHFYNIDSFGKPQGFYNKGNNLYANSYGFSPNVLDELFSDTSPFAINSVWTWYLDTPDPPPEICYLATNCDGSAIVTNTDLSALVASGQYFYITGYSGCFVASVNTTCVGAIPIVVGNTFFANCAACNPTPPAPICYKLHDCAGSIADIITDSDFSVYVGEIIKLPTYANVCWQVSVSNTCEGSVSLNVPVTASYVDCISCSKVCYNLFDCSNQFPAILTDTDVSAYVGKTVTLSNYPGICWQVVLAPNCTGSVALTSTITSTFVDCVSCLRKCYTLTDCAGKSPVIVTDTDLSAYVNKVIKIGGCITVCYFVTATNNCAGFVSVTFTDSFDTCILCDPPPPKKIIPLKTRKVQPNYGNEHCSIDIIEDIYCRFAEQVYNKVIQKKYGVNTCTEDNFDKYLIKKQLLDLNLIYDPNACRVVPVPAVCDPVIVIPPVPVICGLPTNIVVTMSDPPPPSCNPPVINSVQIVYNSNMNISVNPR